MENNNQFDELLVRCLFNEETDEEKVAVENWLNANDENKRYFERLRKAWQLTDLKQSLDYILKEVDLEEKWNRFEHAVTNEEARIIPINEQSTFEHKYPDEEKPARRSVVYRLLVASAIAASVILVMGLAWKFVINNNNKVETTVAVNNERKSDSVSFVVRHEVNMTGKERTIQLPDGSVITLAVKSEITYRELFTERREITLNGKAFFKVAKDKTSPFKVVSGNVSTTALGTEFTVTAFKAENRIIVRLYEGKVMVRSVQPGTRQTIKDVYLLPGQEFIYTNGITKKPKSFKIEDENSPEKIINQEMEWDNPSIPEITQDSWYMFNNESLEQVLDELSVMYNVKIIYNKEQVNKIFFTRRYSRSDSLEFILQEIGTLNNLKITNRDNAFIISK